MTYKALPNRVLVGDIQKGERTVRGIILPNDNGKSHGIRSRWAQIYDVGEGIDEVKVGEWVLLQHGRWTRGVTIKDGDEDIMVWQIDYPAGVLAVSDEPTETYSGEHIIKAEKLVR